jgi:hypothetical protein
VIAQLMVDDTETFGNRYQAGTGGNEATALS